MWGALGILFLLALGAFGVSRPSRAASNHCIICDERGHLARNCPTQSSPNLRPAMNARFDTVHDAIAENAARARRERDRVAALTDEERAEHDRRHARRERDRVAALTDEERAEHDRRHAQLERARLEALTDNERAEYYRQHAQLERERVAAMTDEERAEHDRRHARWERARLEALTDDERAEYYRQHAQLERERVAALTDEERAEHDRRHARWERDRVAALTDEERAEHDQRHAAGERGRRVRAAAAPAAAPSARPLVDTAMPMAAMEAMRLNNAMHVPTAADVAFRVNATNAHLGAEDSNFFVCAVCDVRAQKKEVGWHVQNVNLPAFGTSVLAKNMRARLKRDPAMNPALACQYDAGRHLFAGLLLSKHGFHLAAPPVVATQADLFFLDDSCFNSLMAKSKTNAPPKHAIANGLAIGCFPTEVTGSPLKWVEAKLIALVDLYHYVTIVRAHDSAEGNRMLHSHVTSTLNVKDGVPTCPATMLPAQQPGDFLEVVFPTSLMTSEKALALQHFAVDGDKVAQALAWFIANNPLYAGMQINAPLLQNVAQVDPIQMTEEQTRAATGSSDGQTGGPEMPDQQHVPNGGADIEPASADVRDGTVDPPAAATVMSVSHDIEIDTGLRQRDLSAAAARNHGVGVTKSARSTVSITRSNYFVHLTKGSTLMQAYPFLYPFGTGGPNCKRRVNLSFEDYIAHCMKLATCPLFATEYSYLLVAFDCIGSARVANKVYLSTHFLSNAQQQHILQSFTPELLKAYVEHEAACNEATRTGLLWPPLPAELHGIASAMKKTSANASYYWGSDEERKKMLQSIKSITNRLGSSSLLFTLNLYEGNSMLLRLAAGLVTSATAEGAVDATTIASVDIPLKNWPQDALRHPYAQAVSFDSTVRAFLRHMVGWLAEEGLPSAIPGLFGFTKWYFGAVEEQERLALHVHFLISLHGFPATPTELQSCLANPDFQTRLAAFADSIIVSQLDFPGAPDNCSPASEHLPCQEPTCGGTLFGVDPEHHYGNCVNHVRPAPIAFLCSNAGCPKREQSFAAVVHKCFERWDTASGEEHTSASATLYQRLLSTGDWPFCSEFSPGAETTCGHDHENHPTRLYIKNGTTAEVQRRTHFAKELSWLAFKQQQHKYSHSRSCRKHALAGATHAPCRFRYPKKSAKCTGILLCRTGCCSCKHCQEAHTDGRFCTCDEDGNGGTDRACLQTGDQWKAEARLQNEHTYMDFVHTRSPGHNFTVGFSPAITHVFRCNHDLALLCSASVLHYVTKYVCKAQTSENKVDAALIIGARSIRAKENAAHEAQRRLQQHEPLLGPEAEARKVMNAAAFAASGQSLKIGAPMATMFILRCKESTPGHYFSHNRVTLNTGQLIAKINNQPMFMVLPSVHGPKPRAAAARVELAGRGDDDDDDDDDDNDNENANNNDNDNDNYYGNDDADNNDGDEDNGNGNANNNGSAQNGANISTTYPQFLDYMHRPWRLSSMSWYRFQETFARVKIPTGLREQILAQRENKFAPDDDDTGELTLLEAPANVVSRALYNHEIEDALLPLPLEHAPVHIQELAALPPRSVVVHTCDLQAKKGDHFAFSFSHPRADSMCLERRSSLPSTPSYAPIVLILLGKTPPTPQQVADNPSLALVRAQYTLVMMKPFHTTQDLYAAFMEDAHVLVDTKIQQELADLRAGGQNTHPDLADPAQLTKRVVELAWCLAYDDFMTNDLMEGSVEAAVLKNLMQRDSGGKEARARHQHHVQQMNAAAAAAAAHEAGDRGAVRAQTNFGRDSDDEGDPNDGLVREQVFDFDPDSENLPGQNVGGHAPSDELSADDRIIKILFGSQQAPTPAASHEDGGIHGNGCDDENGPAGGLGLRATSLFFLQFFLRSFPLIAFFAFLTCACYYSSDLALNSHS